MRPRPAGGNDHAGTRLTTARSGRTATESLTDVEFGRRVIHGIEPADTIWPSEYYVSTSLDRPHRGGVSKPFDSRHDFGARIPRSPRAPDRRRIHQLPL